MTDNSKDPLWLMLGEIRGDLKWLVEERRNSNHRMDGIETDLSKKIDEQNSRIQKLEAWKLRVGVLTGALGVFVPTGITVLARKLGLL